ncbi:hypothetical protein PWG14_18050, partial (plasmid) [Chromobacterium amazonense]|uniref:hypothetical protein n=1 Tax=Chromobacterium amazonense TaxID=1382803 RepID=UPI00237D475B
HFQVRQIDFIVEATAGRYADMVVFHFLSSVAGVKNPRCFDSGEGGEILLIEDEAQRSSPPSSTYLISR